MLDGRIIYPCLKVYEYIGSSVNVNDVKNKLGLSGEQIGLTINCTCFTQGPTSYFKGIWIDNTLLNYHSQYIALSYTGNIIFATNAVAGTEVYVHWTITPLYV